MKSKNVEKMVSMMLVLVLSLYMIGGFVFATDDSAGTDTSTSTDGTVEGILGEVLGVLQVVGLAIAVGTLLFIGIKIVSTSPDNRSQAMMSFLPWVIGVIVLVAGTFIGKAIIGIISSGSDGSGDVLDI